MDSRLAIVNILENILISLNCNHLEATNSYQARIIFDGKQISDAMDELHNLRKLISPIEGNSRVEKIEMLNRQFLEDKVQTLEEEIKRLNEVISEMKNGNPQ